MGRARSEKEALRSTVAAVVNRQEREQIEGVCAATGKGISEVVRQGVGVVLTATRGLEGRTWASPQHRATPKDSTGSLRRQEGHRVRDGALTTGWRFSQRR
jgi:hypothetical protein